MLRIKILIFALLFSGGAFSQLLPVLPLRIGAASGGVNNYVFVDSASVTPDVNNSKIIRSPSRNYTAATLLLVQAIDYPFSVNANSAVSDNKGNTYVQVLNAFIPGSQQRVKYYMCFNPDLSGGNVIVTYASTDSITNLASLYVQAYRGVTTLPSYQTNFATSISTIASISTNSVTTTAPSVLVSSIGVGAAITSAPTASGSITTSERMNWFRQVNSRSIFSASYNSVKGSPGTFSVTHTTGGANFSSQTVATIASFQ